MRPKPKSRNTTKAYPPNCWLFCHTASFFMLQEVRRPAREFRSTLGIQNPIRISSTPKEQADSFRETGSPLPAGGFAPEQSHQASRKKASSRRFQRARKKISKKAGSFLFPAGSFWLNRKNNTQHQGHPREKKHFIFAAVPVHFPGGVVVHGDGVREKSQENSGHDGGKPQQAHGPISMKSGRFSSESPLSEK